MLSMAQTASATIRNGPRLFFPAQTMFPLCELFHRLLIAGYGSRPPETDGKPEKNHVLHCTKQRSRAKPTADAIPNKTTNTYSHDFLGANLAQRRTRISSSTRRASFRSLHAPLPSLAPPYLQCHSRQCQMDSLNSRASLDHMRMCG
jgi:hypothetical protein